jgi:hypothetical protein
MVQRKRFAAPRDDSIAVATERMKDGTGSAGATIRQSTAAGARNIDLPICQRAHPPRSDSIVRDDRQRLLLGAQALD